MNEVSNAFVCVLGVGTVFVGLVCIVILCEIMSRACRPRKPAGAAAAAPAAVPAGGGSQDDGVLLAVITAAITAACAGRSRPASHGARIAAPARRSHVSYYESPLPPRRTQASRPAPERRSAGSNRQEVLSAVSAAIAEESGPDVSGIRILSFKKID